MLHLYFLYSNSKRAGHMNFILAICIFYQILCSVYCSQKKSWYSDHQDEWRLYFVNPTTAATITFGGTSPLSLYFNGINHGLGFARWNAMGPITGGVDMKNTLRSAANTGNNGTLSSRPSGGSLSQTLHTNDNSNASGILHYIARTHSSAINSLDSRTYQPRTDIWPVKPFFSGSRPTFFSIAVLYY